MNLRSFIPLSDREPYINQQYCSTEIQCKGGEMDGDSGSVDEVLVAKAWLPVFGSLELMQNPDAATQASVIP